MNGPRSPEIIVAPNNPVEKRLPSEHPTSIYLYASRLFGEGGKDNAVFGFYAGQLRYRVHLASNPKIDPSGDPAIFGALSETIGAPINEYAGGDPEAWHSSILRSLKWDAQVSNGFTSKKDFKKEYEEVRAGLVKLGEWVKANKETIQEQRRKNGKENRD